MSNAPRCSHRGPRLRRIALDALLPRRGHANRMVPRVRKALTEHVRNGRLYPPLIVRPCPRRSGKFEILDGHHRACILRELGFADARCEVWPIGDEAADLYTAALNHLRGHPNAKGRARQLRGLIRRMGERRVAELLALTPAAMRQQLAPLHVPQEILCTVRPLDLRPVTFHLSPDDAKMLSQTLRSFRGKNRTRADALMGAIRGVHRPSRRGRE